ncbi:MAG TPA: acetyl-CoA decarbonylase/synthase complex subunit delta [Chloroflexi bacterium]|nr:acetyl-CoA decarbonylase/synthase complex subunit delta [Chloroflexota bacterium]
MPVTVDIPKENWPGSVREVTLGATAAEGGTRAKTVTVGGETTLPFLHFEGEIPHPPVVAIEIQDYYPDDWSPLLLSAWGDVLRDPATWAEKAEGYGADLIMLRLRGANEEGKETTPEEAVQTVKAVLQATGLPLIVRGPGQAERDNELLVAVAEAAAGERIALGLCEDKNYRTIVAAAMAHDHLVIASTPIDVNLAKQLNILITDMRFPLERILIDPTTGALGYGLEYSYSVMERLRIAALQGDAVIQLPMICFVGEESWRQKESKVGEGVPQEWGDWTKRAITWEAITAITLLHSGADIVTLRHPKTVEIVKRFIEQLMNKG